MCKTVTPLECSDLPLDCKKLKKKIELECYSFSVISVVIKIHYWLVTCTSFCVKGLNVGVGVSIREFMFLLFDLIAFEYVSLKLINTNNLSFKLF